MQFLVIHLLRYYDYSPEFVKRIIRRIVTMLSIILVKTRVFSDAEYLPVQRYFVRVSSVKKISKRIDHHNILLKYYYHGQIIGGNWDCEYEQIKKTPLYEFSEKVFVLGYSMEDTEYYQRILDGELEPYIQGENHLRLRMKTFINLFKKIREIGYKEQGKLNKGNILDEVCISIDRDGGFILEDGRHRFMIALCLKLEKIPVIVNRVHEEYYERYYSDKKIEFSPFS